MFFEDLDVLPPDPVAAADWVEAVAPLDPSAALKDDLGVVEEPAVGVDAELLAPRLTLLVAAEVL